MTGTSGLDPQEQIERPDYVAPEHDDVEPEVQVGNDSFVEPYEAASKPVKEIQ